ncbi:carboxypeptidase M32 [Fluviispira multicolorata]|uniref:Metal-dependent carboxypeptidase n=1 Tax=Fluviispira multicolorata TaxID=2654512 RepID=A0A833JFJ6_9BACT|nr:carboxypeptidase M32 [Fluviispira multicolorata]KAB8033350.1 carboxypeptidase M32 [Fluviispira multicolorata]
MNSAECFKKLSDLICEVTEMRSISNLLHWDQNTYMPIQGAKGRGRQVATLGKITHEKFTSVEIGKLLEQLEGYENQIPYHSFESSFLRLVRREFQLATQVPAKFISEMLNHFSACYNTWIKARAENNFKLIQSMLEKSIEFSIQYADFFPHKHISDPLIAEFDYGFSAASVQEIFTKLRVELLPFVKEVLNQEQENHDFLNKKYPKDLQKEIVERILKEIGYDMSRGRVDVTYHPFMLSLSHGDVRITTRYDEDNFTDSLLSTIHEAGHAFYELGNAESLDGSILFGGTSAGIHESQSRLWENMVGRSFSFWEFFYPTLQKTFSDQLNNVSVQQFYAGINKVTPSLIRTEADELTYNLHVMIRCDLETQMLEGNLKVKDLPEAWNARYLSDLGIKVTNDVNGCLQDVHWFSGLVGGSFQGYTLGNIMSAQFYDAAHAALPNLKSEMKAGNFVNLKNWLTENIHCHGKKFTGLEVLKMATKSELNIANYMNYLKKKFPIK